MKKILLSLVLITSVSLAQAQSIGIVDNNGNDIKNTTITFSRTMDDTDPFQSFEVKQFASVVNNTSSTMTIGLKRYEVSVQPNTGDAMCWGATCFGEKKAGAQPVWDVQDQAVVNAMDTARGLAGFVVYHYPNQRAGQSTYRYEFYDRADTTVTASLFVTFDINVDTVAVRLLDSNNTSVANDTMLVDALVDTTNANQQVELIEPITSIVNFSGDTNDLMIRRIESNVLANTGDALCFGDSCYSRQTAGMNATWNVPLGISTPPTDTARGSRTFTVYHYPNKLEGSSIYKYEVYNASDTTVVASFFVHFRMSIPTGIGELKDKFAFNVYPNPAEDITTIQFENELNYQDQLIEINGITGESIELIPIARGTRTMELDLSSYASGIYFVNVQLAGNRIISKKLIVK